MHWFLLVGFIAAHFLTYIALFRHLKTFAGERTILIYHGVAFAIVLALVTVAFARETIGFAAWCGLLALQFIYSISFLELWSLAQGSYSLQILMWVAQKPVTSRAEIIAKCETIGAAKKHRRLDNLVAFRLAARTDDGRLQLSRLGGIFVSTLRAIMWLSSVRSAD
jgi:hypothetical protein